MKRMMKTAERFENDLKVRRIQDNDAEYNNIYNIVYGIMGLHF